MRSPRWGSTRQALLAWTRNKVERAEGRGYRGGNARAEQSPRLSECFPLFLSVVMRVTLSHLLKLR